MFSYIFYDPLANFSHIHTYTITQLGVMWLLSIFFSSSTTCNYICWHALWLFFYFWWYYKCDSWFLFHLGYNLLTPRLTVEDWRHTSVAEQQPRCLWFLALEKNAFNYDYWFYSQQHWWNWSFVHSLDFIKYFDSLLNYSEHYQVNSWVKHFLSQY